VRELKFDGAMIVTASHNPPEYNGLKFVTSLGMFTNESDVEEIKSYLSKEGLKRAGGKISTDETLGAKHVAHILEKIDRDLISGKKFKVVLDPINSAGSVLGPELLRELGCEVVVINGEPNGQFAHMPEPLPENLQGLGSTVRAEGATLGFAQDPDADRLVVCNEKGEVVFEEYTLSLAVKAALSKTPGDIVINMSTSSTNEVLAKSFGGETFTPNYQDHSGHYEAVLIEYDATVTSYKKLLQYFIDHIDPTDGEGQFADKGKSYRAAIFCENANERDIAKSVIEELNNSGVYSTPSKVLILERKPFYKAEEYHQNYAEKNETQYGLYRLRSGREDFVQNICEIREGKHIQWSE
jgi:methionine-S-sulfoxide reductase